MTEEQSAVAEQALSRARGGRTCQNDAIVIVEFTRRGVEGEIIPRVNALTYHAWRALGRTVKKGEHGVKLATYVPCEKEVKDKATGETRTETFVRPKSATVFHVSQTKEL